MELEILKKKISTYRTDGGHVRNVSDEVLLELLNSWEQCTGPATEFARSLGLNRKSIPKLIGKAKKLKREGFPTGDFKEITIEGVTSSSSSPPSGPLVACAGTIELGLTDGRVIRFPQVDQLVEFLKKAA
jgi:hypothetical protein